jgi:hypothetical protein
MTREDSISLTSAVPCITETKSVEKVTGNGSNDTFSMAVFGIKANVPLWSKTESIGRLETTLMAAAGASRVLMSYSLATTTLMPSSSQVEAQVTDLTQRIVMLEKNQQAGFDKVHRRLDALEVSNSQRASPLETSRALFGRQGAEQETRYTQQEWVAEPSRITLPERQVAEQRSRLFRHATEQEARFP